MIGPGTGVKVYLACGVTDMRRGSRASRQSHETRSAPRPVLRRCVRVPGAPRRPGEAALLGWPGLLPLLQGARARAFSLALSGGRDSTAHPGAARDALGSHRLATAELGCTAIPRRVIIHWNQRDNDSLAAASRI